MRLILASGSPRRREFLQQRGVTFRVLTKETDETLPQGTPPRCGVEMLAVRKGAAVAASADAEDYILSADTLVECDGIPLGKPRSAEEAHRMLSQLSGTCHTVHTGIALHHAGRVVSGADSTAVFFRALSEAEIAAYVQSGEPMDKAGAYGIQGRAAAFIDHIEGNFDTVVGFSMDLCERLLNEEGVSLADFVALPDDER